MAMLLQSSLQGVMPSFSQGFTITPTIAYVTAFAANVS
jgi:hypothetical protein